VPHKLNQRVGALLQPPDTSPAVSVPALADLTTIRVTVQNNDHDDYDDTAAGSSG